MPSTTDPKWTVGIFRAFFFKEKKNISAAFGPGVWFFSFQRSNLDDFRTFPTHPDQSPLNGIPLLIPSGLRRRWNDTTKHRKRTLRGEAATIDQDMQQKLSNNTLKRFGFLFYPVLPYDFINTHRASIFRHQDREVLLSMVRTPYNNLGLHNSSTTKYDRRARKCTMFVRVFMLVTGPFFVLAWSTSPNLELVTCMTFRSIFLIYLCGRWSK